MSPSGLIKVSRELISEIDIKSSLFLPLQAHFITENMFFHILSKKDDFTLFMGGEKQRVIVFSGDLDDWEQSLEERGAFDEENCRDVFDNLCQDLQQGSRHFSHELMLPHLIRGDEKELYLIMIQQKRCSNSL